MMKVVPTRVGDAYQAEIPPMLSPAERETRQTRLPCRPQWTPAQSMLSDREIDEYLRCTRLNESEAALRCLHDAAFDVREAAQLLYKERQERVRRARQREAAMTEDEFEAAVLAHGKRFFAMRQQHPAAATRDLVARFYLWKTTTAYKKWRERAKAKKHKEAARLRQWADAAEAELADFHNEYCELCVTGGQLLCCDGCERAYHFSCVEPPIKDVPMGDWFCVSCAAILGAETDERASAENPHCPEAVVLVPSPPAATGTATTTRSEYDGSSDGNDTDEIEDTTMEDDDGGVGAERGGEVKVEVEAAVAVKQEPVAFQQHQRLYTPERPRARPLLLLQAKRAVALDGDATPTKSPLLLESTNRKRQRKLGAPRRIPQSDVAP